MAQEMLYWQALNRAMDLEMEADESVFTLGEDVGLYGGSYRVTEGLYAKYGEWRVRDTPISENSFTGLGVGAALVGMRPVVEIMTINFALLAMDSIVNGAAKIPSCRADNSRCRWSCACPAASRASSARNMRSGSSRCS